MAADWRDKRLYECVTCGDELSYREMRRDGTRTGATVCRECHRSTQIRRWIRSLLGDD